MPDITKTLADARATVETALRHAALGFRQGETFVSAEKALAAVDEMAVIVATAAVQAGLNALDAAAVTQGAGTEEVERALSVGALMANVMFNLKQGQSSGERERAIYADLQRQWDAAVGPARAALAARAAPASTPAGWRPIETAPKDTLILFYGAKRLEMTVGMNHSRDGWVSDSTSEFLSMYPPTHWMPLPAAPSSPSAEPPQGAAQP